jgi:hypothetical protein
MSIEQGRYVFTLTVLESELLMSIVLDRYVCSLTVLQSQCITYMVQDRFVYHNNATVTLVNVYRKRPGCVP